MFITTSKSTVSFDYTVVSNSSNIGDATNEGELIVVTVARDNSGSESTVYFDLTPGTATEGDYKNYGRFSIKFEAHETEKKFAIGPIKTLDEGTESYNLNLYKTTNRFE